MGWLQVIVNNANKGRSMNLKEVKVGAKVKNKKKSSRQSAGAVSKSKKAVRKTLFEKKTKVGLALRGLIKDKVSKGARFLNLAFRKINQSLGKAGEDRGKVDVGKAGENAGFVVSD